MIGGPAAAGPPLQPIGCDDTRGSTPKGFGVYGPAALPLFCLAPHGVFPASRITSRAVSSYLAFSTLPALRCQRTGGVFSATLSVAAVLQPRRPRVLRGMLPYGVRTFLCQALRLTSDRLPSSRIYHSTQPGKAGMNQENYYPGGDASPRRPGIVLRARRRTARRAIPTCQRAPPSHSRFESSVFFFAAAGLFKESNQLARKNFFSVGKKVFDGAMMGRSVVIICKQTTTKINPQSLR
jgi:hypothetical protein